MMSRKRSKLVIAKEKARVAPTDLERSEIKDFRKDVLKHYVRVYHWMKQIKGLLRTRQIQKVRYLSLPAAAALDARLFVREGLVEKLVDKPIPVVFCESEKKYFDILVDTYKDKHQAFYGKIEDIATNANSDQYGAFWGTFPIDVINLDFWGDIHTAKDVTNIFYAIDAIISHQKFLREAYELWITWRAKPDRIANNVEKAYVDLIKQNIEDSNLKFGAEFGKHFPNQKPNELDADDLVRIGFIKWILYVTKKEFSIIDKKNTRVLIYSRSDKDGSKYRIYNFLMRIKPYESIAMPSPASEAAKFCEDKYAASAQLCFGEPVDVDAEFRKLSKLKRGDLKKGLEALVKEYESVRSSSLK